MNMRGSSLRGARETATRLTVCLCLLAVAAAGCSSGDNGSAGAPSGSGAPGAARPGESTLAARREAMVRNIERGYGLSDKTVLAAMRAVPRHEFVPPKLRRLAYADGPLPIGEGQTISQPYIVAEMTRQLHLKSDSRVLEVGTGSGYQAAVLAEITPHVFTIEIVKSLADSAARRLARLGYDTVAVRHGDGYAGWKARAPFDAIVVTCGAAEPPKPLIDQLAPGGRMVIPVGEAGSVQQLQVIEKDADGKVTVYPLMAVRFVPLTRELR